MQANNTFINNKWVRALQHILFWVISFYVFLQLFKTGEKPGKLDYIYTALFHATILPAVYFNLFWLLPTIGNFRNRYRWYWHLLTIAALVFIFAWINYSFFEKWSNSVLPDYFFISYFTFREVILFFIVYIIVTMLLKLSKSWFLVSRLQKELLEKEKQKAEVELKALKAQINPHFFFNTLNSIYSMALDKDERLPGTVLQLSDLMRYFLYESKDNFVPLEKELAVADNYIALQRIRSGEQLRVQINKEGEVRGQKIAPLLLITFLENAFKHGAKGSSANTFIRLDIKVEKDKLSIVVENNKGIIDEVNTWEYNGLGLENVKRQLELLYPGKHILNIKDQEDRFTVELQLSL